MGKRARIIKDLQIYKSMAGRLCKIPKIDGVRSCLKVHCLALVHITPAKKRS